MTPRLGTAENKEVIQAARWIDCRQFGWIDRLKILVVHPLWNRSPPSWRMELKKIARPFAGKQIPLLGDRLATLVLPPEAAVF
jgi:hypothetical protein